MGGFERWAALALWLAACGAGPDGPGGPDAAADAHATATPDVSRAGDSAPPGPPPDPGTPFANPVFELTIPPASQALLDADVWADTAVPGTFALGEKTWDVEVEYQGASARTRPKKSWRVKFPKDKPFFGDAYGEGLVAARTLILKAMYLDQSLMREALAFRIADALGRTPPRVGFANVELNGAYWGLYAVVEPVDERFVERLGLDDDGPLYKAVEQLATLAPGVDPHAAFEKKEEEDEPWTDLEALLALLQKTPLTEGAFLADIDPSFPLDPWMDRQIWIAYTQNLDATTQNYYLYREGERWWVFPWDSDVCLANHWKPDAATFPVEEKHLLVGKNHFTKRLVHVDALRTRYVARFGQALDGPLAGDAVRALALALYDRVKDDLPLDHARWKRSSTPEQERDEILDFIERRPVWLRARLAELADDPDLPDPYVHGLE